MTQEQQLPAQYAGARRIVLVGGPGVGKTTKALELGKLLDVPLVRSTDVLVEGRGWSAVSRAAEGWLEDEGPWILEGCAMVRALRKYLAEHPRSSPLARPCDLVLVRFTSRKQLTKEQAALGKGVRTVLVEIRGELAKRGVRFGSF